MIDIHPPTRTRPPDAPRPRVVSVLSQKGGTGKGRTQLPTRDAEYGRVCGVH